MPDLALNASPFSSQAFANITLFDSLLQSDLEDPQLRMCGWEMLKEKAVIGPLNIPMMMRQVEQMVLNTGRRPCNNVNELFEHFAARLAPEFEVAQVPEAARQVTELQLNSLQERLREHYENAALETIWNACLHRQFHDQGAFAQEPPPSGHQAIREWLNNPINQPRIQQITQFEPAGLGLINLGLRALPPEIGLFTGLISLNFSENQLSFLPDSFGSLQALKWLNLSQNQLSFLPDSFVSLKTLNELYLNQNRLSFLPDSFGSLQALNHLFLENNQLRNLPDSFGRLPLYYLYLSNNQLSSLPDSFSNLQTLNHLFLNNNQLCLLPKSFGKMKDSCWIVLDGNSLMLTLDPAWGKPFITGSKLKSYLAQVRKYVPQSLLAAIFKAIIFQQPVEMIQEAYAQLSPNMQLRIANLATHNSPLSSIPGPMPASSSSDLGPIPKSLFTDMGLFARSVRKAAYELYDSLEPEHKKLVHYHIWDLAGRPETDDSNWGEHHVFDHVLRFTDSLERASQS
ncbi:MAG: leucine-rich repeat domain-containing protein [Parachlamydiales bacterium]